MFFSKKQIFPKKIKKIILCLFVVAEILSVVFIPTAASAGICIPCIAITVAQTMERRYNLNLGSIQNAGQNFNVSSDKNIAPQVKINFVPSEPKVGQKIMAKATPMFFSNSKERLYFTWYISHGDNFEDNKDLNDDGDVDQEDGKIEAMRIISQNGYNNQDDPRPNYDGGDNDSDGYEAIIGGDDKKNMPHYCYVHDFETGLNCELIESIGSTTDAENNVSYDPESGCSHFFPKTHGHGEVGDGKFSNVNDEEKFWGTNPQDPNTARNGNLDEANVAGLGQDEFSWTYQSGDKVGVIVEGTSMLPTKHDDSSYMVMWALPKNDFICDENDDSTEKSAVTCPTGYTARCAESEFNYSVGGGFAGDITVTDSEKCKYNGLTPYCSGSVPMCATGIPKCVPSSVSKNVGEYYSEADHGYIDLNDDDSGCTASSGGGSAYKRCEYIRFINCNDTPTCEEDAGSTNNNEQLCTTGYKELIKGYRVWIDAVKTSEFNLDNCLNENLVDPAEKTQKKLDVSVSFTPENPINDMTENKMGDILFLQSIINNSTVDPSQLHYEWIIERSKDGTANADNNNWISISEDLKEQKLLEGPTVGTNLQSINIKLNLGRNYLNKDIDYLRARVKVTDNKDMGAGEAIIKINSTSNRIVASVASIGSNQNLSFGSDNIICNSGSSEEEKRDYYSCPIIKNQILGLKVDKEDLNDFFWTVNGKALNCDSNISSQCSSDGKMGNVNFLPITGGEGEIMNVKLTAKKIGSGKNLELSRVFRIVDPYIKIISNDINSVWPKPLGIFKNLEDDTAHEEFSDSLFITNNGNTPKFKAELHPLWLNSWIEKSEAKSKIEWLLDGESSGSLNEFNFVADKEPGDAYSVEINSIYDNSEVRKVLLSKWNVPQNNSAEKYLSSAIVTEVVEASEGSAAFLKIPGKFLASLASNLPAQVIFLLRLTLSVFIVILISGIAFAFPFDYENKNKKVSN